MGNETISAEMKEISATVLDMAINAIERGEYGQGIDILRRFKEELNEVRPFGGVGCHPQGERIVDTLGLDKDQA